MKFEHLLFESKNQIATITLNNPEKYNCFDIQIIKDLTTLLQKINNDSDIRVVILQAAGKHFSAGANLHWMQQQINYSQQQNEQDALLLADLLHTLSTLPQPVIGLVQGRAMGGGIGLVACCDIAIGTPDTKFCFSEVKLGLVPATIAPYVIRSIGYSLARRYFISAEMFGAEKAQHFGLLHKIVDDNELKKMGVAFAEQLMQNSSNAMRNSKELVNHLATVDKSIQEYSAKLLAEVRVSPEGQEGVKAFLEKRKPSWNK
jgi:methylglutaconyl-CoA hydratase